MNETYIKLYRKALDNPILARDNNAFIMFTKLLLKVDYATGKTTLGRKQLSALCNMKSGTSYATTRRLVDNNFITTKSNPRFTEITVVNWAKYQGNKKESQQLDDNLMTTSCLNDNTIKRIKNKNKNNSTNVLLGVSPSYGKGEINSLFDYWQKTIGYEISSNKANNRRACNNLLKKHGEENTKRLIDGVSLASSDKFAPTISDFVDLQAKLNSLLLWGKKKGTSGNGTLVI